MEPCWLCHFNHTTDAKTLSAYIAENMGCASTASIAGQVSQDLRERFPDAEGTCQDSVLRHIELHSLNPTCRIATMLRALLRLSDDMQQNLRKFDEEGNATMDPKLVETYLKVQSQIMAIYRTSETNKLLFSEKGI